MKPFKKRTAPYKTLINEEGRICTKCGVFKKWSEFNSASTKAIRIKRTSSCKKCKVEGRKAKGRDIKRELITARAWREHLKKVDPYLVRARSLRQGLLTRVKTVELKATTPNTEQLYNWFLSSVPIVCHYSGIVLNLLKKSNAKLTVDHKIPIVRGGTNVLTNLCFASHHMNTAKGSMTEEEFIQLLNLISTWEDKGYSLLRRLKQGHF